MALRESQRGTVFPSAASSCGSARHPGRRGGSSRTANYTRGVVMYVGSTSYYAFGQGGRNKKIRRRITTEQADLLGRVTSWALRSVRGYDIVAMTIIYTKGLPITSRKTDLPTSLANEPRQSSNAHNHRFRQRSVKGRILKILGWCFRIGISLMCPWYPVSQRWYH